MLSLIFSEYASARAGGGSGGGGGGGGGGGSGGGGYYGGRGHYYRDRYEPWDSIDYFIFYGLIGLVIIFLLFAFFGLRWMIRKKSRKAKKIIEISETEDPVWNHDNTLKHVHDVFMKMQDAWMSQNMNKVDGIATKYLRRKYTDMLEQQKIYGIYNYLNKIKIDEIKIVGAIDSGDNNKDRFTAYIKGEMVDMLVKRKGEIIKEKEKEEFEDLYYFIRKNNKWVVENIINEVDIWELKILKIYKE
ncbi:MAG: TIM44-like domain-containing protein [Bacteroidota bacterium]